MSDENEFISEDENNASSNSDSGGETATFEEVVVESPQIQESFEMISVGPENQEEDKVDDSEKLPIEERIEEVRIDNENLSDDESVVEPPITRTRKRSNKRKTRKLAGTLTSTKSKEGQELSKPEEKAIQAFQTQITERLKLNEQKLDKVISTIRPIEKHIHSTEKQAQLSRQIQVQVRQLQKQVQQIEKMSKNISTEIIKKINKEITYKLQRLPARGTGPNRSKRNEKAKSKKKTKISKRKKL
ncbi:MAG: hypothetical protein WCA39_08270 [Nitrososphaeraceae archaeon]